MDNKYCKKCNTALIVCNECNGTGKKGFNTPNRCVHCKGTGYLCHIHGGDNGN